MQHTGENGEQCQVRGCGEVRKQEGTFVYVNDVNSHFKNCVEIKIHYRFCFCLQGWFRERIGSVAYILGDGRL